MCGRFSLSKPSSISSFFTGLTLPEELRARYNIAPSSQVLIVLNDGQIRFDLARWGLIPSWASDPQIGNSLINARAETLAEKPSFRQAFKKRRCLIPVDGFFEWTKGPGSKTRTPIHIRMKTGEPFAFAGLWEQWRSPDGESIRSCTIVTTTPNDLLSAFHHRMPVIVSPENYERWLDPRLDSSEVQDILVPYPPERMAAYKVSTLVNDPKNDLFECIQPAV